MAKARTYMLRLMLALVAAAVARGAMADVTATYDDDATVLTICCLEIPDTKPSGRDDLQVNLRHVSAPAGSSMLKTVSFSERSIIVMPAFPLLPGEGYVATLSWGGSEQLSFNFSAGSRDASIPELIAISPSASAIPANTLRLYLTFSEAMARGQVREYIYLEDERGDRLESPFLSLSAELWDADQRRLTLLLDPGRIKRGVGPNESHGAPLKEGSSYKLIVSGLFRSAAGVELGVDRSKVFRVSGAERRPLAMRNWIVSSPDSPSRDPLTVIFDRAMDAGALARMLRVTDANGEWIQGSVTVSDDKWSFSPRSEWQRGTYTLWVDAEVEDISGNSLVGSFDVDIERDRGDPQKSSFGFQVL